MKRALIIVSISIAILIITFKTLIQWIDEKPWISYLDNRFGIKVVARVYDANPFASKEDNIRRTIKIAHFIALSNINQKSLDLMLLDFNEAQGLIDSFIHKNVANLDSDAIGELTLERVSLLNRMNAILLLSNRSSSINIESAKRTAYDLLKDLGDDETKRALEKEIHLYDTSRYKVHMDKVNIKGDQIFAIDAYHYGLASCAMQNDLGAKLIELGLANIPKDQLIDVLLRNIDHPLIAAADAVSKPACTSAIDNIKKKLRN